MAEFTAGAVRTAPSTAIATLLASDAWTCWAAVVVIRANVFAPGPSSATTTTHCWMPPPLSSSAFAEMMSGPVSGAGPG